jgi:hypothetical protein
MQKKQSEKNKIPGISTGFSIAGVIKSFHFAHYKIAFRHCFSSMFKAFQL